MRVTVDASIVVKWFPAEPMRDEVCLLLARRIRLFAPGLVLAEFGNTIADPNAATTRSPKSTCHGRYCIPCQTGKPDVILRTRSGVSSTNSSRARIKALAIESAASSLPGRAIH